jgi:tRNA threonylcarbamoyladenosine biosynthesis protein TsaB
LKILAIDTSSAVASVCISEEYKILSEFNVNYKLTHSQTIMPMINKVLDSIECNINDIDYFAVSTGPGSFTGLRIGVGTIKGLAQGGGKRVVGINTLDGLAYNVIHSESIICPIMDARRQQVYNALYESKNNSLKIIKEYRAVSIEDLIDEINHINEKVIFVGDGIDKYREIIVENIKGKFSFAQINIRTQKASSIACLAIDKIKANEAENFLNIKPFYLRQSQAEREYEKNKQK